MSKVSLEGIPMQQPPQQRAETQPGDGDYVPPTEIIPLPSKGKIYDVSHPFYGKDCVEVREMSAVEENILTSPALLKQGKAITALLKSCLVCKSVNPDELLVGDRSSIMIGVRVLGYGADYKIEVSCPACDEKCKHVFNLSKLPIKPLNVEPVSDGANLFSFKLPNMKKEVLFKLPTGNDDNELSQIIERTKKATAVEQIVTTKLSYLITSFGGETDKGKIAALVRKMPAKDSKVLRKYIDDISPSVDLTQEFQCPNCNKVSEVSVPLGTEFFWPSE